MHDADMVAAIAAGDPDGLAAAYDQFGESLYTYCHLMLPDTGEVSQAVRDIFLIASARVGELRDPDKLRSWLYAVARHECLRRRHAAGVTSRPPDIPKAGNGYAVPAAFAVPARLRGQVLKACADNTPAGRAERVSVAHRAGTFGPAGFPKTVGSSGKRWWPRVRQHPRVTGTVAGLAAVTVAAAVIALVAFGGPHHARAATLAAGSDVRGASASPAVSGTGGGSSAPGQRPASAQGTPGAPAPGRTATPDAAVSHNPSPSSSSASGTPSSASPSASSAPSPSPSPSPSATATAGTLVVSPTKLALTGASGKAVRGTFLLSASGGPSNYTITVPAGVASKVTVSPASGSLVAGGYVTVTVTVTSKVALSTVLVVNPGKVGVTVTFTVKA
jgi:DNA-directed RNA polymerase specialized sigma24 family protein